MDSSLSLSESFSYHKLQSAFAATNCVQETFHFSTGLCALAQPWEGLLIGSVGALISLFGIQGLDWLHIDDPVGKISGDSGAVGGPALEREEGDFHLKFVGDGTKIRDEVAPDPLNQPLKTETLWILIDQPTHRRFAVLRRIYSMLCRAEVLGSMRVNSCWLRDSGC